MATVTLTGFGMYRTSSTTLNGPTATAKSRTAEASQRPGPTRVPEARTRSPGGAEIRAAKSAVGDVEDSPKDVVGGSVAHPTPGCQARMGKKDPSRTVLPSWPRRSRTGPGSVRCQAILAV